MEEWKDVPGFQGKYQVSNHGRLISIKSGMILKSSPQSRGYYNHVFTSSGSKPKSFLIHRLVAELFIDNPNNLPEVNHLDFNKANNHHSNLEWVTGKENKRHAIVNDRFGAKQKMLGSKNHRSKLKEEDVKVIKSLKGVMKSNQLAKQFDVSTTTINTIWRDKVWKHVQL